MTAAIELDGPDDPRAALYRDSRDADLRGRHGLFLVESETCIRRWLDGVRRRREGGRLPPALGIESLLLAREVHARLRKAVEAAQVPQVLVADASVVERISGFDHHHGALGLGRRSIDDGADLEALLDAAEQVPVAGPAGADATTGDDAAARTAGTDATFLPPRAIVATDGVVHVDNMGSIFRNAAALGAAGVLLSPRCADPLVRKTIRISMGHVFAVPWATAPDLPAALRRLAARGWRIVAAENAAGALDVDAAPLGGRCVVVFGAEGHGISPAVLAEASLVIRVPSRCGVPLNVAVASAIVMHELGRAERQRAARGR